MKVCLDLCSLKAAAEFLEENNHFLNRSTDEWEDEIRRLIVKTVESQSSYMSTGGVTVILDYIDDECVHVDITVSPSIGNYAFYETEIVGKKLVVSI